MLGIAGIGLPGAIAGWDREKGWTWRSSLIDVLLATLLDHRANASNAAAEIIAAQLSGLQAKSVTAVAF